MYKEANLAELSRDISEKLFTSKILLEILQEMTMNDVKIGTVAAIFLNYINEAFNDISECRKKIFVLD